MSIRLIALLFTVSILAGLAAFAAGRITAEDKPVTTRVYELRTYTALPGRLPALNKRFADHTFQNGSGSVNLAPHGARSF